jgi:hypothetical protein
MTERRNIRKNLCSRDWNRSGTPGTALALARALVLSACMLSMAPRQGGLGGLRLQLNDLHGHSVLLHSLAGYAIMPPPDPIHSACRANLDTFASSFHLSSVLQCLLALSCNTQQCFLPRSFQKKMARHCSHPCAIFFPPLPLLGRPPSLETAPLLFPPPPTGVCRWC